MNQEFPVIVQNDLIPKLSVIWLHGLGADGYDFQPVVPHLGIPKDYSVRFVFPHAPYRAVTINAGMRMRAWYDVKDPEFGNRGEDRAGIEQSAIIVNQLIQNEKSMGLNTEQIILAGFSQGGAIALFAGLRCPESLAGILALSTYLPLAESTQSEWKTANQKTPILYMHGRLDPVIPFTTAERSFEYLRKIGCTVTQKSFEMAHAVSMEEIVEIGAWISKIYKNVNQVAG